MRRGGGAALFSHSGEHIFAAAAGTVAVLDAGSLQVLRVLQARSPRRRTGMRHGRLRFFAAEHWRARACAAMRRASSHGSRTRARRVRRRAWTA